MYLKWDTWIKREIFVLTSSQCAIYPNIAEREAAACLYRWQFSVASLQVLVTSKVRSFVYLIFLTKIVLHDRKNCMLRCLLNVVVFFLYVADSYLNRIYVVLRQY